MSHQIIKQPNGKYCIYSSVVDDIVVYNATPDAIKEYYLAKERERIYNDVNKLINKLEKGEKPYHQFTLTFNEMCEDILEHHKDEKDIIKEFKKNIKEMKKGGK